MKGRTTLLTAALLALAGCAPATAPGAPPIAAVHVRQCGRCHAPPRPGTKTREHLEDAFQRHRTRVQLTPEQWQAMVDYLAAKSD